MGVLAECTSDGIRDGAPDALAALCIRRGGAVLAYCEHVAAPGQASHAAADALAQFRLAVVRSSDLTELDADAVLLSATRRAAVARSVVAMLADEFATDECYGADSLLVDWMEEQLPWRARDSLMRHVPGCDRCLAALARLEAAERAYKDPPKVPVPAYVTRAFVAALAAAAPVRALGGDAMRVREAAERMVTDPAASTRPREAPPAGPAALNGAAAARRGPAVNAPGAPSGSRPAQRAKPVPPSPHPSKGPKHAGERLRGSLALSQLLVRWIPIGRRRRDGYARPPRSPKVALVLVAVAAAIGSLSLFLAFGSAQSSDDDAVSAPGTSVRDDGARQEASPDEGGAGTGNSGGGATKRTEGASGADEGKQRGSSRSTSERFSRSAGTNGASGNRAIRSAGNAPAATPPPLPRATSRQVAASAVA